MNVLRCVDYFSVVLLYFRLVLLTFSGGNTIAYRRKVSLEP